MQLFLAIFLGTIFLVLAGIHFYWAGGGKWGFLNALPEDEQGQKVMAPGPGLTVLVAIALLIPVLHFVNEMGLIRLPISADVAYAATVLIGLVFLGRAIGDFRYVGFFKQVRHTDFAVQDARYFTPLCLIIALACACYLLAI